MICDDTRRRLTAYLDGDLDADAGTLVRVHLRGCPECRQAASDEAALRDELRALPVLDPPASLWSGVQARLAAAEEADARRPRWRRALARWAPVMPRYALSGLVAAAAVAVVWWRTNRTDEPGPGPVPAPVVVVNRSPEIKPASPPPPPRPTCHIPEASDVTADLALDDARRSGCYAAEVEDMLASTAQLRAGWAAGQRETFEARLASLRKAVEEAEEGKPRHRAWRSVVRYLQGALVRDEVVALASGGIP